MQKNKASFTTISAILKEGRIDNDIENSDCETILSFVICKSKEFIYTYPETKINLREYKLYKELVKKRKNNTPLAYIIGKKEFYGFTFKVNKHVLIPRPETELIIDEVLKIKELNSNKISIIDIGTGSGCIVISLAKLITNKLNFFGLDISKKALKVAKENSILNKVNNKINFINSDLFNFFMKNQERLLPINIVIANLPYLTKKEFKKEKTIQKEPKIALLASKNGLYFYEKLFKQIRKIENFKKYYIFCEINPWQKNKIIAMIKKYFPQADIVVIKDLRKMDRLIKITIKKPNLY